MTTNNSLTSNENLIITFLKCSRILISILNLTNYILMWLALLVNPFFDIYCVYTTRCTSNLFVDNTHL